MLSFLMQEYQEGEIVALCCIKYHERPQLGMVLETRDDKVTIKWYDGCWSWKVKVYTYKESRNSEYVAWGRNCTHWGHYFRQNRIY